MAGSISSGSGLPAALRGVSSSPASAAPSSAALASGPAAPPPQRRPQPKATPRDRDPTTTPAIPKPKKRGPRVCHLKPKTGFRDVLPDPDQRCYSDLQECWMQVCAHTGKTRYDNTTWPLMKEEMAMRGWKIWQPKFPSDRKAPVWLHHGEWRHRMRLWKDWAVVASRAG